MVTRFRVFACAVILTSALASTSRPAWAAVAHLAVVSRGADPSGNRAAVLVGHALREAFSRDERYEVIDLNKVLGSSDRDRALHAFQDAEEMAQIGREAFDGMELGTAVEALNNALARYEHQAAYVSNFKAVGDVLVLLGATHMLRHEDQKAVARLQEAYIVNPQVEPDWHSFTPAMRAQFQDIVRRLQKRPPLPLTVSSTPSAAEVYLDGRFVGVTPLSLPAILEGRHYIRVDKEGYRPAGDVLEAIHGSTASYNATLKAVQHFDAVDALAVTACRLHTSDAATKLATNVGADNVFVTRVVADHGTVTVSASLFDAGGAHLVKAGERSFADDGQLDTYPREVAALLHSMVGGAAGAAPVVATALLGMAHAPGSRCLGGMPCRSFKALTLSIVGGLGVVAAGIGVYEWVESRDDYNKWSALAQTNPAQAGLASNGKQHALVGDILVTAGGALMVGSVLAAFLWDTPGDPKPAHAWWYLTPHGDGARVSAGWAF